ncbi:hypothetical protein D0Z08_17440 [Nocardioides immobilis]|uniref:ANTAR domain-containing protein n=1 Tax=Nocardioides immobilis TaxID=2049295 RepID=A0A417XZK3_9ACTN|nr:hypothetical protein [Nocardioides immobilis]RHW25820.1 hypothetical protein D0Z08_17440 [Nocardioides immobilis]
MIGAGTAGEWIHFLDARDAVDAISELTRMVQRLDDASDEVTGVLYTLSGSPSCDVEEILRVARAATYEAIGLLSSVITRIRLDNPDAA